MSGDFIDTNIVVYAFGEDPRADRAEAILRLAPTISVQVLNEFAHVGIRKLKWDWLRLRMALAELILLCPTILPLTHIIHRTAMEIAERYRFRFYDAVIVASALEGGCDTLFSEDMQDGLTIAGRLTIRNPFA